MKKYFMIALAILVAASFAACGCQRTPDPSTPPSTTTAPTTDTGMMPDIIPTMETNIPDPSVDTEMPIYTEGTDNNANETTDTTGTGMGGK